MKTSDDIAQASTELLLAKALQQIVDLKEFIAERDRRYGEKFESQENAWKAEFDAREKAIQAAHDNSEKWRANANEWRASMVDREARFASKDECDAKFEALSKTFASIEKIVHERQAKGEGKAAMWGYIVAAVSFLGMIITIGVAMLKFGK